jgi:hypothetical protein
VLIILKLDYKIKINFKDFLIFMKKRISNKYITEATNFLTKNPSIKSIDIVLHDVNGVG